MIIIIIIRIKAVVVRNEINDDNNMNKAPKYDYLIIIRIVNYNNDYNCRC